MYISDTGAKLIIAVAFAAVAGGFAYLKSLNNPVEDGVSYLRNQGYTHITGGEQRSSLLNGCGKRSVARAYSVMDTKGQYTTKTVCLGGLHDPRIGS